MTRHDQPSRNEDEYFVKQDAELLKEMRAKLDAERAVDPLLGYTDGLALFQSLLSRVAA